MGIGFSDLSAEAQKKVLALYSQVACKEKQNKYKNTKTQVSNLVFDSKKEARRFETLCAALGEGVIRNLKLQKEFTLQEAYTLPSGERVRAIRYRADFCYEKTDGDKWVLVVEDVKSRATKTAVYAMKKKMMIDIYGIVIKEV